MTNAIENTDVRIEEKGAQKREGLKLKILLSRAPSCKKNLSSFF